MIYHRHRLRLANQLMQFRSSLTEQLADQLWYPLAGQLRDQLKAPLCDYLEGLEDTLWTQPKEDDL